VQRGKRKVPCGGSSALCKGARASPWPPGPRVRPLWAPLPLLGWWETPDPLGNQPTAALARAIRSRGEHGGAAAFPAAVHSAGREAAGETRRPRWVPDPLSPRHEGHWRSSRRQGGEGGSKPQSSIASSWSARSSNMLLMSSRMFLAECMAPGRLGGKGRESEHGPEAAGRVGVGVARLDPTPSAAAGAQHAAGLEHVCPAAAGGTCLCPPRRLPDSP